MFLTFAQDTIVHLNSFSVIQTIQHQLMFGQLDVLLLSLFLDSQSSLGKVVLISLLK